MADQPTGEPSEAVPPVTPSSTENPALQRLLQRTSTARQQPVGGALGQTTGPGADGGQTSRGLGATATGGGGGARPTSTRLQGLLRRSRLNRTRSQESPPPRRAGGGGDPLLEEDDEDDDDDEEEGAAAAAARKATPKRPIRRRSFKNRGDPSSSSSSSSYWLQVDEQDVERQPLLPASSSSSSLSSPFVALDLSGLDEDTPLLAIRPEDVDGVLERAATEDDGGVGGAQGQAGGVEAKAKAESSRDRYVVYVESATTGRFFRVALRPSGAFRRQVEDLIEGRKLASVSPPSSVLSALPPPSAHEVTLQGLEWRFGFLYLTLQGVLAGSTLWVMYTALTSDSVEAFVRCYSSVAREARRAFFVMASVSLVGSVDLLLTARKDREKWEEVLGRTERAEIVMQVVLYLVTLLSSLVAGVVDNILYWDKRRAGSSSSSDWLASASLQDGRLLSLWYIFSGLRCVCCNLAWLVAVKIYQDDMARANTSFKQAKAWNKAMSKADLKIAHLQGQRLEAIRSRAELVELVAAQRAGLEATEAALDKLSKAVAAAGGGQWSGGRGGGGGQGAATPRDPPGAAGGAARTVR